MTSSPGLTLTLIASLFLFSCGGKQESKDFLAEMPADSLIAPDKMALLMSDVYMVEGAMVLQRTDDNEPVEKSAWYYQGLYKKYHISKSRFDQNILFYRSEPAAFTKIHEQAIRILEERQERVTHQKR